ncbi:hypothetical protein ABK040_007023 [Willaertia magna]
MQKLGHFLHTPHSPCGSPFKKRITVSSFLLNNKRYFSTNLITFYNPYQVLGVDPSMSDEEIKKIYLKLTKQYHPDLIKNKENIEENKMSEINAAYEQIKKDRLQQTSNNATYTNQRYQNFTKDPYGFGNYYNPFTQVPFTDEPFSERFEKYKKGERTWFSDGEYITVIGLLNKDRSEKERIKEWEKRRDTINLYFKNSNRIFIYFLYHSNFVYENALDIKINGITRMKIAVIVFKILIVFFYIFLGFALIMGFRSLMKGSVKEKKMRLNEVQNDNVRKAQVNRYRQLTRDDSNRSRYSFKEERNVTQQDESAINNNIKNISNRNTNIEEISNNDPDYIRYRKLKQVLRENKD